MESKMMQTTSPMTDAPAVSVSSIDGIQHLVRFDGLPMLNGKTRTCFSCEIWAMIDPSIGFTYLSTENQSPCTVNYSPSAIGKTVAYRLRWIDNLGNCGPWSEIYNQTIE
jgi:hypothetical protein